MPDPSEPIRLYSMVICPFAQRTRIHLRRLGLPFELENLDICRPRPDWFLTLNPKGQVPVLVWGDDVVCDSSTISAYLHEAAPTRLPSGDEQEAFVEFVDQRFVPALYWLMAARTPDERAERLAGARKTFVELDAFLPACAAADFVHGDFGLPEVAIAPFLLRYEVVAYYQDLDLPDHEFPKLAAWWRRVLDHPVVSETAESIPDLVKLYEDYTIGYYNGAVPDGRETSSLDLSIPLTSRPTPPRAASVR